MKIKFNNKVLQRMIEFKVKVKEVPNGKVTAEYEIFKGQPNYYNPLVAFNIKDEYAKQILEYVAATLGTNQTSVELENRGLMKVLNIKDRKTISNAIQVLIDNNCMYRWQDIIDVDNVIKPNRNWYLLNPLVVRNISYDDWTSNEKHTVKEINDKAGYAIGNYDALTLDSFIDIPNDNANNDVIDKDRKALVLKSLGRRGVKS